MLLPVIRKGIEMQESMELVYFTKYVNYMLGNIIIIAYGLFLINQVCGYWFWLIHIGIYGDFLRFHRVATKPS